MVTVKTFEIGTDVLSPNPEMTKEKASSELIDLQGLGTQSLEVTQVRQNI